MPSLDFHDRKMLVQVQMDVIQFFLFAPLPMWCPFLSHSYSSFFSYFTTKKVDTHTFVSVYFHFTGAHSVAMPSRFICFRLRRPKAGRSLFLAEAILRSFAQALDVGAVHVDDHGRHDDAAHGD